VYVRDYFVELHLLSKEEGGGWMASVPDLPGCMSDGETIEQAAENVSDAIDCWLAAARRLGREVPVPTDVQLRRA
jgi:predicted RNase H-like HicB family nuclease